MMSKQARLVHFETSWETASTIPDLCQSFGLCQNSFNYVSMHIGEANIPPGIQKCLFFMIDSKLMENRCPQIVDRGWAIDDVVAQLVRSTINCSALESSTSEPDGEAVWIMITTIAPL